jgi:hypothetical protein
MIPPVKELKLCQKVGFGGDFWRSVGSFHRAKTEVSPGEKQNQAHAQQKAHRIESKDEATSHFTYLPQHVYKQSKIKMMIFLPCKAATPLDTIL